MSFDDSYDRVTHLGEVAARSSRYSKKAVAKGGNMLFYIHIPNKPSREEHQPVVPDHTTEPNQKLPVHHHSTQLSKIHHRVRETYHLQRRLFI